MSRAHPITNADTPGLLVCPRDRGPLAAAGGELACGRGHRYPTVGDIPILLLEELPGNEAINESLKLAKNPTPEWYRGETIHPLVKVMLGATSGYLYRGMEPTRYPIPSIRLPEGEGRTLLDLGSNWGRWTVAAAKKGYRATGLDPHFEALRAARVVAGQCGVTADFVCGDARQMPFADASFDVIFSYSMVQHFAKKEARQMLREVARVLKPGGFSLIQMPNRYGVRSLYHQTRRGFSEGRAFDVRYYSPGELKRTFEDIIGPSELSVDGFFGLGIQPDDIDLMPLKYRAVIRASETLRGASRRLTSLVNVADSLYLTSRRG